MTILAEDKDVRFVMKDFPILGNTSSILSKAAVAVYQVAPEKWFDFHIAMLKTTPRNEAQILALAGQHGIDAETLKTQINAATVQRQIEKNMTLGSDIGVRGTPALVINGRFIRGAVDVEELRRLVAEARAAS